MKHITVLILMGAAAAISGCATISEESCISGSWEALGYENGRDGDSRGKFSKIAETCTKYGITADYAQYRRGYDQGLPLYCSYDRGIRHGENGSSPKAECREIAAAAYLDGYDEGRVIYELRREYRAMLDHYDETHYALVDVLNRLASEDLAPEERKRLMKKRSRLKRRLDETRIDVRAFERVHGWPKTELAKPIPRRPN